MNADKLALLIGKFSYPLVFALLAACGIGAPLSEDLIAIAGGVVVSRGAAVLGFMMLTVFLGILVGDTIAFRIGQRLGPAITKHKRFGKILTPSRMAWVAEHFERRGRATIFIARFTPGLRMPTFLSAGACGMRYRTFIAIDAVAAAIVAPLVTWLGYKFGTAAIEHVRSGGNAILITVGAVAAILVTVAWIKNRRNAVQPA